MNLLSVVIITCNEERNIRECLESVKWADEIIIVDAYSRDKTLEIAGKYTDKVFLNEWMGFGPQKNLGIDKATSSWILIVDADERITQELRVEIEDRLSNPSCNRFVGYQVPRRNYFYGKWVRWGGAYPDYQLRFFRKDSGRYNDLPVHENLILQGLIGHLKNPIDHLADRCISDRFIKLDRYSALGAKETAKMKGRVRWYDIGFRPIAPFIKAYVLKKGYRDGIYGLIYGTFAGFYTFSKYVKLWEMLKESKRSRETA